MLSGASAPRLKSCIWAQALAISPCLSRIVDMAVPACIFCWSRDCLADLTSRLGLRPVSSPQTFLCNFITVVVMREVIQAAVKLVNPGLVWICIHYDSFPPPFASSTHKTPGLPSLCLQDFSHIKSLRSQPTLPPHLHHASESRTCADGVAGDEPVQVPLAGTCQPFFPWGHPFAKSLQELCIFVILCSSAKFAWANRYKSYQRERMIQTVGDQIKSITCVLLICQILSVIVCCLAM